MTVFAFESPLEIAPRGGAVITIPLDVYDALGGSGRIPVTATFDGVAYRGSVVRMGAPRGSVSRARFALSMVGASSHSQTMDSNGNAR